MTLYRFSPALLAVFFPTAVGKAFPGEVEEVVAMHPSSDSDERPAFAQACADDP